MTEWLLNAIWTLCLVLVLWAILSIPASAIAWLVDFFKLADMARAIRAWLLGIPAMLWRIPESLFPPSDHDGISIRVIFDRRLFRLRQEIKAFDKTTKQATDALAGLGEESGPNSVTANMNVISEEMKRLADIDREMEVDTDLEKAYRKGSGAAVMFWIFLILTIMIAACNALLISEFFASFSSLQRRVAGVPLYTAISSVYVLIELGCGAVIHYGVVKRIHVITAVGFVIAAGLVFVEFIILGMASASFDLEDPLFGEGSLLSHWLGILGIALALLNCTMGYMLHQLLETMSEHRGGQRLLRETKESNRIWGAFPARFEGIQTRARTASASVDEYLSTLGDRAAVFGGAVDEVKRQRQAVLDALREANVANWSQWLEGRDGDRTANGIASIGAALGWTIMAVLFSWGLQSQLGAAFPDSDSAVNWVLAALAVVALTVVGFFCFEKVQLATRDDQARVAPLRSGPVEQVAAGVAITGIGGALIAVAVLANGWTGIAIGILLLGIGGAIVALGYYLDRFFVGTVDIGLFLLRLIIVLAALAVGIPLYLLAWAILLLLYVVYAIVWVVAVPLKLVVTLWKARAEAKRERERERATLAAARAPAASAPVQPQGTA